MTDPLGDWRPVVPKGRQAFAHTPNNAGTWHAFRDHALTVANLAAEFASGFGGAEAASLAGLVHDSGKLTVEAQDALVRCAEGLQKKLGVPHKQEGAGLAFSRLADPLGQMVVSMVVYGHHHRLPCLVQEPRAQMLRAQKWPASLDLVAQRLDYEVEGKLEEAIRGFRLPSRLSLHSDPIDIELFMRMVHSAVVDADFLDTSAHFNSEVAPRLSTPRGMVALRDHFHRWYEQRFGAASPTDVNQVRREVFDRAVRVGTDADLAASHGIYRLPAPTGSGKTMAAAAFALNHAAAFGKRRVIVAVPFTSITTQNAAEYRKAFGGLGDDVVLEHHSNIIDEAAEDSWCQLSSESWDAEFIVTTTVQLFESLFSGRPAAARKLHRIANSVIVLDEIQALPIHLLTSILGVLRRLARDYGVTVLLASATQPSFWKLNVWHDLPCIDVVPVGGLPEMGRRVQWEVRSTPLGWDTLADEVASQPQAMVIVNTTADAQALHGLIEERGTGTSVLHLSTRMFPLHRADVLDETRRLLKCGEPVILVSTQLIEAGVDVDFPVVFRALAPAESLIQSAGRCNREGLLAEGGRVVVFEPADGGLPPGAYAMATGLARNLFVERVRELDDPADLDFYYGQLYATALGHDNTSDEIRAAQTKLDYPRVSELFRMIDEATVAVVVPDQGPPELSATLSPLLTRLEGDPTATLHRGERQLLQRFSASLPRRVAASSLVVDELPSGVLIWRGDYDPRRGVVVESGGAVW